MFTVSRYALPVGLFLTNSVCGMYRRGRQDRAVRECIQDFRASRYGKDRLTRIRNEDLTSVRGRAAASLLAENNLLRRARNRSERSRAARIPIEKCPANDYEVRKMTRRIPVVRDLHTMVDHTKYGLGKSVVVKPERNEDIDRLTHDTTRRVFGTWGFSYSATVVVCGYYGWKRIQSKRDPKYRISHDRKHYPGDLYEVCAGRDKSATTGSHHWTGVRGQDPIDYTSGNYRILVQVQVSPKQPWSRWISGRCETQLWWLEKRGKFHCIYPLAHPSEFPEVTHDQPIHVTVS